jgi:hypothetical protein
MRRIEVWRGGALTRPSATLPAGEGPGEITALWNVRAFSLWEKVPEGRMRARLLVRFAIPA